MPGLKELRRRIRAAVNPQKAAFFKRFFKTGKGEYAEGDRFLGLSVPQVRALTQDFRELSLADAEKLLASPWHEERLAALEILVGQYERGAEALRRKIFELYRRNMGRIDNWDLIDGSAEHIVGPQLAGRDKALLYRWARSKRLWDRRVAMLSTFHYIRRGDFEETLKIAEILLEDEEDLIHKAVGWLLREVGKRDLKSEETFLKKHYKRMPRTMLRYAIERFPEPQRLAYLKGSI